MSRTLTTIAFLIGVIAAHAEEPIMQTLEANNARVCRSHLEKIRDALHTYQTDHGDIPAWLSDLYPRYLSDAEILLCPADADRGNPIYPDGKDPKLPSSYLYEFHPLWRAEKDAERRAYGDGTPLVRCWHHNPVVDLTYGGTIRPYVSSEWGTGSWQDEPSVVDSLTVNLRGAIASGVADAEAKRSTVFFMDIIRYLTIEQRTALADDVKRALDANPNNGTAQKIVATIALTENRSEEALVTMEAARHLLPDDVEVAYQLGRLYEQKGRQADALASLEAALRLRDGTTRPFWGFYPRSPQHEIEVIRLYVAVGRQKDAEALAARFESSAASDDIGAQFTLGDVQLALKRYPDALATFQRIAEKSPDDSSVNERIAAVYEALGDAALASEYRRRADPGLMLVGQPAPDFEGTDLSGARIARPGLLGKVVLLNFWASW